MKGIFMTKRLEKRMASIAAKFSFKPEAEIAKYQKEMAAVDKRIIEAIQKDAGKPVQLSWLPTKTARASFFAPIADKDLKNQFTELVYKGKWGVCEVSGPPLNIVDEGIFLGILYLVREQKSATVKVNYKRLCNMLGLSYQTRNRRRIKKGIEKLFKTSVILNFKDGLYSMDHILERVSGDKRHSIIMVNEWFYTTFLHNEITRLNMDFRQSLRGDVVKCLYRFLVSHRGTQKYYTETLIEALNLNPNRPTKKNRDSLKRAFSQLYNRGFLSFQYDHKGDIFRDITIQQKGLLQRTK